MSVLLTLARIIDRINEAIGRFISWALLLAVLICSGNAIMRYAFDTSSNAWLEIQWYLFSAVFLLAAPYTLRRNEHVRIDVIAGKFSRRTQIGIDIFGILAFLMPMALIMLNFALPYAWLSFQNQEMSSNAGGLIVWPAKMLIPFGFALLALQGVSELIKRIGYFRGRVPESEFEKHVAEPVAERAGE
ncbi:TRAP transporter small permease subunit [Noviherbaspirillum album]|nr:TRAP transporter small permease subunit [Noviherbaspirillum sp. CPCC 100848]